MAAVTVTTKQQLEALGEEKYTKITNELMRGTGITTVARMVQSWGDFAGVPEATMIQKLSRFRQSIAKQAIGTAGAKTIPAPKTIAKLVSTDLDAKVACLKTFRTKATKYDVLSELITLVGLQQHRIDVAFKKENRDGKINSQLNTLLGDYKDLLLDIQKLQFDLGLDEFKGIPPTGFRGATTVTTLPDGTTTQRAVFEAATVIDSIFHTRGIADPQLVEGQI